MSNSCECCKRYWSHLHGKVKHFVRQMDRNLRHSMIIPQSFMNHFPEKISRTIKLDAPNGIVYEVRVREQRNRTVLQSGWETFVDANHIVENDSLMFRYRGSSCFEVLVFDSSGCEKVVSCAHKRKSTSAQETTTGSTEMPSNSRDGSTELSASGRSDGCRSSSGHCRKRHAHLLASERSDGYQSGTPGHCKRRRKTAVISSTSEESEEDSPSECESIESDNDQITPEPDYVLPSKSYLSEAQKEKVVGLLQEVQPEITAFVAVMVKCNVQPDYPFLTIPKEYADGVVDFPHGSTTITLQRPGRNEKWHPKFYKRASKSVLRGIWSDFVRDNHVMEGDICTFVPTIGGERFTFTVHLLRQETTRAGTCSKRTGLSHGTTNASIDSVVSMEELTDGENVSSENMHGACHESPQCEGSNGPSDPPYILPLGTRLSMFQKKEIEEKVQAIQSEIPIYVSILKNSNIGATNHCMLELCVEYAAAAYLPHSKQTVMLQCMGKIWKTNMLVVHNGKRRYLSRGWPKFVFDNHLQSGDICLFELKKSKKKLSMVVHLLRKESIAEASDASHVLGSNHGSASASTASIMRVKEEPADEQDDGFTEEPLEYDDSEGASELPYMMPRYASLTQEQEKEVLKKVAAIESELPIYVSVMNKTNVSATHRCSLTFCRQYAAAYLGKGRWSLVLQQEGDSRTWQAVTCDSNARIYGGWRIFARDNRLKEGDICLFKLLKEGQPKLMIYIIRREQC